MVDISLAGVVTPHKEDDKVPVTLHLTLEAAAILHQYASERGRGQFISELLVALRRRDDEVARQVERYLQSKAGRKHSKRSKRR